MAECSASWLKLAGMPRREPFTRVDWITFRAATSAAGDAEPAFPVAGLTESTVGAGTGEGEGTRRRLEAHNKRLQASGRHRGRHRPDIIVQEGYCGGDDVLPIDVDPNLFLSKPLYGV